MESSTTELASLAESWEEVAENPESLEKQLSKVKIMNRSSPDKEALKPQSSFKQVTILSGDEQHRTQYVPETKLTIMKRPSPSAADAAAARPKAPLKTLEQRQAEYNEARIRILGNAEPVIHDKSDSSALTSNSADAVKNCSPVAQGAQRGLITGAAARQQQQAKQQQRHKQNKTSNNLQNKRGNSIANNNNLVNQSNGSPLADSSSVVQQQQQPPAPNGQGAQPGNVSSSIYNTRVPQFYSSEGQAAMHPYQQPSAFVPAHCYPPPMSSCQQFPTSMPVQQLASSLSQQFTMSTQDFSLPASHQQYPNSSVTIGPYGAALTPQHYLPHTVAGATPGPVYSPYPHAPQHPYPCFPRMQYQLPAQPPMISLHHPHHQQQPALPPTSFALQQQTLSQALPSAVEAQQLTAVQQPRQQNKKQKKKNKKNEPSHVGTDKPTSPTPAESRPHTAGVSGKTHAITTNGSDSTRLTDAVVETSSSPRGVSPEESVDPTPMETITKKNKKKKKKTQAKASSTNPTMTTGKSIGTLSSKEGNGRIIRMPRGPDGTKGFNWVRHSCKLLDQIAFYYFLPPVPPPAAQQLINDFSGYRNAFS
ncbi:SUZ domain [Trinorchestia longiramus]|nr:SUZ domain [Trinorchestia longiramus]